MRHSSGDTPDGPMRLFNRIDCRRDREEVAARYVRAYPFK